MFASAKHRCLCCLRHAASAALLLAACGGKVFGAPLDVTIVSGGDGEAYSEIADAVRAGLGKETRVALVSWQKLEPALGGDVVVAVGVKATQVLAERNLGQPVLSTLIPRNSYEKIVREAGRASGRHFSAIFLDQPLARQFELIRYVLPGRWRVGAVLGPDSRLLLPALEAAAEEYKLRLAVETIDNNDELFSALQKVLEESELLLALPDTLVFNPGTIQNVMLTTYRYRQPLIGFSAAYVKAGALAAVYSTPAQLAKQVVEVLRQFATELPPPQYPKYYSVRVNQHVARSLGISVLSEEQLLEKLTRTERSP